MFPLRKRRMIRVVRLVAAKIISVDEAREMLGLPKKG